MEEGLYIFRHNAFAMHSPFRTIYLLSFSLFLKLKYLFRNHKASMQSVYDYYSFVQCNFITAFYLPLSLPSTYVYCLIPMFSMYFSALCLLALLCALWIIFNLFQCSVSLHCLYYLRFKVFLFEITD